MTPKVVTNYKAPSHMLEAGAKPAVVSPVALVGTWNNTDHATRDIVKIVIAAAGTNLTVDVFGACTPSPCVWGTVPGFAYADNVSSTPSVAFTAQYTFSFAKVIVTGHLDGKYLDLESFTEFTDGSGRSNLYTTDRMAK